MNYRHAFHAGNFADVVKHAVLARIVMHLRKKDTAFRVIDTHAGAGRYNLQGSEAIRGGEWQDGIGRMWTHDFAAPVAALLAPYREAVAAFNPDGRLAVYPGSPLLVRHWLRSQDRLIACELETGAAGALGRLLRNDERAKAVTIDGWTALNAYIPPKEKRGLVLIDPPYERPDELNRSAELLAAAWRKWTTGLFLLWYPIKDASEIAAFARALAKSGVTNSLRMELTRTAAAAGKLRGTGLIAINPPWTLAGEAKILLPALAGCFWPGEKHTLRIEPAPAS